MGPSALRYAALQSRLEGLGYDVRDQGNIATTDLAALVQGDGRAKYLDEVCGLDGSLRHRLERLLASHESDGGLLNRYPGDLLGALAERELG